LARRSITDRSLYLLSHYLPKVVSRVAAALRNREHQFGEDGRWVKCRLGMTEGITAMAGQLAEIFSGVITRRVADREAEAFKQTPAIQARRIFNLQKQAAKFGLQLLPAS
jgi:hypothetical protein